MTPLKLDPGTALKMLALTTMRPFEHDDWAVFPGCSSAAPLIGEYDDDGDAITVVVDDADLTFYRDEDWAAFKLTEV